MTTFYDTRESDENANACEQIGRDKAALSAELFNLYKLMKEMRLEGVDEFINRQCWANQISYPPKKQEVVA